MSKLTALFVCMLIVAWGGDLCAQEGWGSFSVGLMTGLTKFEGDLHYPRLNPLFIAHVKYFPNPYFGFGLGGGYSNLTSRDAEEKVNLKWDNTSVIPIDADLTFRMYPFNKVSPYATLGGSGVYWESTRGDTFLIRGGWDAFIKIGGGLEFNISSNIKLDVGANFRYCPVVDALEHRESGDENDGFLDGHVGLTFNFPTSNKFDLDSDGIPNELDLDIRKAEDNDGYKDHDGVPEEDPDMSVFLDKLDSLDFDQTTLVDQGEKDVHPPIVIHKPIRKAESGQELKINAFAFEDDSLKVCAVLYRMRSELEWSVNEMSRQSGTAFKYYTSIPGTYVTSAGLEYFVVAVDESVTGIGYSGLPSRPLQVQVFNNPQKWRRWSGILAALSWSAGSYLVLRRQK